MKCPLGAAVLRLALLIGPCCAVLLSKQQYEAAPKIAVDLLVKLQGEVENEGDTELKAYDEGACWCEKTLAQETEDLSKAKESIDGLDNRIVELRGSTASLSAEGAQLEKSIEEAQMAIQESREVCASTKEEYEKSNADNIEARDALEKAIKVLAADGAAGKKKSDSFLAVHEAELISVVAGLRGVLGRAGVSASLSESDREAVKRFIEQPTSLVEQPEPQQQMGLVQLGDEATQNPFGDYVRQSGRIVGILQQMYHEIQDVMSGDEEEYKKEMERCADLAAVKNEELTTMKDTHTRTEKAKADQSMELQESRSTLEDLKTQVTKGEAFVEETKTACISKAEAWSARSRLRTQELNSISKALTILKSPAVAKNKRLADAFLQLNTDVFATRQQQRVSAAIAASQSLKALGVRGHNLMLLEVAREVRVSGSVHFGKVLKMLDHQIEMLRTEMQEDVDHRDRCEEAMHSNKNALEDGEAAAAKAEDEAEDLGKRLQELGTDATDAQKEMDDAQKAFKALQDTRRDERQAYLKDMAKDKEAMAALAQAIEHLEATCNLKNGVPLAAVQEDEESDAESEDDPKAEDGSGKNCRQSMLNIITILRGIKDGVDKGMGVAKKDEVANQASFAGMKAELQEQLDAFNAHKIDLDKRKAEVERSAAQAEEDKAQLKAKEKADGETQAGLEADCKWVKTHFEKRKLKREAEIEGLQTAKSVLSKV